MKLKQINGIWHVKYKPGPGRPMTTVSTGCRDAAKARLVVAASKIKDIELTARAQAVTLGAIQTIVYGNRDITMKGIVREYVAWMQEMRRAPNSIQSTRTILNAWLKHCDITEKPSYAIEETCVSAFVNRAGKWKHNTRLAWLFILRSFFDWMAAKSYIKGNPARLVKVDCTNLTHEQMEPTKKVPFTDEEYAALLKVVDEKDDDFWKFAIRIGRITALRLSDIAGLEWKSLAEPGKVIVWMDKTNQRIEITVDAAFAELISRLERDDEQYVFPGPRITCNDPETRHALSMQFKRLAEKAGISKSFHCLRVTRVNEEAKNGGIESAQKLAGHFSSATTQKHYVQ